MNPKEVAEAHEHYMKVRSLTQTCLWLNAKGHKITRNVLSRKFHTAGLRVLPPNGKPELYYGEGSNSWRSWEAKLAGAFIKLLHSDLEKGQLIDRMSAAWALQGDTYKIMLAVLVGDVVVPPSLYEAIPGGVPASDVDELIDLYAACNAAWVEAEGESIVESAVH